jgi:hypothetical protein
MIRSLALLLLLAAGMAACASIEQPKPDRSEERLDVGPEAPIPSSRR